MGLVFMNNRITKTEGEQRCGRKFQNLQQCNFRTSLILRGERDNYGLTTEDTQNRKVRI